MDDVGLMYGNDAVDELGEDLEVLLSIDMSFSLFNIVFESLP
jgi:hypothetical protein